VLFGHHAGDVRENVLANVLKGTGSLLELGGMLPESRASGVCVWRPLLAHDKEALYACARAHGVPWLLDTTPAWSNRGRTRNELAPLLCDMYGPGHVGRLSQLAADADALRELVHARLLRPFWAGAAVGAAGLTVPCTAWAEMPAFWWREALRVLCEERLGVGRIREKAVPNLLLHLARARAGWLSLKRENRTLLLRGGALAIFRTAFFPARVQSRVWIRAGAEHRFRAARDLPDGARCELRAGARVAFGPWTVELGWPGGAGTERGAAVAVVAFDDVMRGAFAYAVRASRDGRYELRAARSPPPLRALDATVRCALPNVWALEAEGDEDEGGDERDAAEGEALVLVSCWFDGGWSDDGARV
jgi:hypothetical protein